MFRRLSCQLPIMASSRNKFVPEYWVQAAQAHQRPMWYQSSRHPQHSANDIWAQQIPHNFYDRYYGRAMPGSGGYQDTRMLFPKSRARKQEDRSPDPKASRNDQKVKETLFRREAGSTGEKKRESRKIQPLPETRSTMLTTKGDTPLKKSRQGASGSHRVNPRPFNGYSDPSKRWYYPHTFQQRNYSDSRRETFCYHKDRRAPCPSSSPGKVTNCNNFFADDQRSNASTSAASGSPKDANDIIYRFERSWEDIDSPDGLPQDQRTMRKLIRIVSYNILSQKLLNLNNYLYKKCNPDVLPWEYRWTKLKSEIEELDADVLCLQEVEECHYLDHILRFLQSLNYQCNYKRRTGNNANKPDGVLIAFKKQQFKVCEEKKVEYFRGKLSPVNQDNVAVITVLKPIFHESARPGSCICFVNTHLLYNPNRGDIKLAQLATLFSEVQNVLSKYKKSNVPIVLCGDFNSIPKSYLYDFITKEEINYEGLEAKFISGQKVSKGGRGRVQYIPSPLLPGYMKVSSNGCTQTSHNSDEVDEAESHSEERFKLRHSLGLLQSVYSHDKPEASTTQDKGVTVDYIFHSPYECAKGKLSLYPAKRLSLIHPSDLQKAHGIPNAVHPSDHLPVVADFTLVHH